MHVGNIEFWQIDLWTYEIALLTYNWKSTWRNLPIISKMWILKFFKIYAIMKSLYATLMSKYNSLIIAQPTFLMIKYIFVDFLWEQQPSRYLLRHALIYTYWYNNNKRQSLWPSTKAKVLLSTAIEIKISWITITRMVF